MGLRAGKFNRRISIQQMGTTQDEIGQPVAGWVEFLACWADIRHVSGKDAAKADTEISAARASIRIRWAEGVTAAMRVVCGSAVYSIKAVLPDLAGRQYVDLICEASA